MRKLTTIAFSIVLFGLLASDSTFGQTVGKIFTKAAADSLFGKAVESVSMNPADLKTLISKTENYILFRVASGWATVLGDGRKAIYPSVDAAVGKTDVYHLYSKSLVVELLSKGIGDVVYLENRKNVFSVTYGEYTLEFSILCPPFCPGD